MFHIGEITYETGDGFSCSDPTLWNGIGTDSLSGASVSKYTVKYPGLFNVERKCFIIGKKTNYVLICFV